ncbi:MAG: TIGR00341 family protein [Candidatus Heimdallarchaeota archaeon]|nr:TIGR00341 family protein [Candidatus Heimdallarchaeota archaeon]MDH5645009.1 TIGR00341 family protein [Candidatus Heimdallarchaeota archaeon]
MKEIRIEVPADQVDIVSDLIATYSLRASEMILINGNHLIILKVQDQHTNTLLHELKSRGVGIIFGEVTMVPLNLWLFSSTKKTTMQSSSAANLEEILANLVDSAVLSGTYLSLVILSGALAAFGLVANSVVIIIGSMIVAPLLGPVALTSIGVLTPGKGYFWKGILAEIVGISITIFMGIIIGLLTIHLIPDGGTHEMRIRANEADPFNIIFAIISGIAAGLIISKGQSLSMVGVAIAASLAPPAANIGLYLAMVNYEGAILAGSILLINVFAINLSCSIMFRLYGLVSKAGISKRRETKAQKLSQRMTLIAIIGFFTLSIYFLNQLNTL